ncbi:MAG: hypothetical protein JXB04_04900 [Kiritimatiellae bacterium]|nr:hypothetical protein [Kiritimatiellia bacterium]
MIRSGLVVLILLLATLTPARAQAPQGAAAADDPRIPTKWFQGAKGYEKALELQKTTAADLLIYFSRPNTPDEKGLCNWFESKGLAALPVRKLLRGYIKVEVVLPGNPDNQKLAAEFRFNKTPAVYVLHPDGWRNRCHVFEWENKRPKLLEPDELARVIRLSSSEKYHLPGDLPGDAQEQQK